MGRSMSVVTGVPRASAGMLKVARSERASGMLHVLPESGAPTCFIFKCLKKYGNNCFICKHLIAICSRESKRTLFSATI